MELEKLIERPYRMRLYPIIEEGELEWAVEYPDLPGCVAGGDTPKEAIEMGEDAKRSWIEVAYEYGKKIPSPSKKDENQYSGKFTLRIPKSLHRELSLKAEEQDISLNQYLLYLITKNHFDDENNNNKKTFEYVETFKREVTTNGAMRDWSNATKDNNFIRNSIVYNKGGFSDGQRETR